MSRSGGSSMRLRKVLEEATTGEADVIRSRMPFIALVDDVLSADECRALVDRIESLSPTFAPITTLRGFENRPDLRNNDRVMFDDADLARRLFERLKPIVPAKITTPGRSDDVELAPVGLNERFRGYRYNPGQRFAPHFDGAFVRDERERSELTVLFYLNDGFSGGATAFLDWGVKVDPRRGQALLFCHPILHEGCLLERGTKYVLRSDVMYRA